MIDDRNTRFHYLYRDGSNCKQYSSVVERDGHERTRRLLEKLAKENPHEPD